MKIPKIPRDFRDLLKCFNTHEVRYLVVGGYAVSFHGFPRYTGDIDLWIAVDRKNAEGVTSALQEFGFNVPGLNPELFLEKGRMVRMGKEPTKIEILTQISGVEFDSCYESRILGQSQELEIPFLSLPDLRKNKSASARPKDLGDLDNLPTV